MSDWKEVSLSDITSILGDGLHGTPNYDDNGDYIFINGRNLGDGQIIFTDKDKKVSYDEYCKYKKKLNDRTILVSINGTLGNIALYNNEKVVLGKSVCYFNVNDDVDKNFVRYVLSSSNFQNYIHNLSTGSTIKNVSLKLMRNFRFYLPNDLNVQKKISSILKSFDDKIQLNNETNKTLENIAQAIFKSWFIDFDPVKAKANALAQDLDETTANRHAMQTISGKTETELKELEQTNPNAFAELKTTAELFPSEIGDNGVPKGWGISTIGETYNVVMGQSPKGETYNENGQGILFYQGRAEFGWRFPKPRLFTTDPKRIAPKNSVLMSVRAPVGDLNVALNECCIGRGLTALQHKSGSFSFTFYQIKSIQNKLNLFNGEGTVFGSINQKDLKNISVIQPTDEIIDRFDKHCANFDKMIENNELNSLSLEELRDTLLPKLLSGEVI